MTHAVRTASPSTGNGRRSRGVRSVGLLVALLVGGPTLFAATAVATPAVKPSTVDSTRSVATADGPIVTFGLVPTQIKGQPVRANFDLQMDPGQELNDSVRVSNLSGNTLTLTMVATDALNTAEGAIDLLPTAEKPRDAGAWISLDKESVTIASNSFIDVPFKLKVPQGAEPGDHSAGIVASYIGETASSTAGQAVVIDRRIGTRVQIRVAGALKPQLAISNLKADYNRTWSPVGRGTMNISYRVTNTGNVRMAVDQKIRISSPFGIPATTVQPKSLAELLPGNTVDVVERVSGVWPTVRATTKVSLTPRAGREGDIFPPNVAAASKTSTWTMPWATIIAIVLILIAIKVRYDMQRRKLQEDAERLEALVDARIGGGVAEHANGISPNGHAPNGNAYAPGQSGARPAQPTAQHPTHLGGQG